MDHLKGRFFQLLFFYFLLFFSSSCSKLSYMLEQGVGQLSLLHKARVNEEVLKDVKISQKSKDKILLIQDYKKYFYDYFERKTTEIYSKTSILDSKAATYLVIASKKTEVVAKTECFPLVGCFPYLGFYREKSAVNWAKKLEQQGHMTYTRPVYAYSTLGNFTDPILSSFFNYSKEGLAEVIFHELFHTVFFIKNEVHFNETLANFVGKQMVKTYFQHDSEYLQKASVIDLKNRALTLYVVTLIKSYKAKLEALERSSVEGERMLRLFLEKVFFPSIKKYCFSKKIASKSCYPLWQKWNHASMAALMTYEGKSDQLQEEFFKSGLSLRAFFRHIEKIYRRYQKGSKGLHFSNFFWKNIDL